jgi:hypothetical protein
MQLVHDEYQDPIGRALDVAVVVARDHTMDHPLTPELLWEALEEDGFHMAHNPADADEHGRFFAHLVLDHAFALKRIAGNVAQHHYWGLQ